MVALRNLKGREGVEVEEELAGFEVWGLKGKSGKGEGQRRSQTQRTELLS